MKTQELSYKAEVLRSMMKAMIEEKVRRGWHIRPNCLLEDAAGNVFTLDLSQGVDNVKLSLKRVNII